MASGGDSDEVLMGGNPETITLMIKNLPCRCSAREVLDAIASVGYGSDYSFFHLPLNARHSANFGYAFVGFERIDVVSGFAEAMTGYRFTGRSSQKACTIASARIQDFRSYLDLARTNTDKPVQNHGSSALSRTRSPATPPIPRKLLKNVPSTCFAQEEDSTAETSLHPHDVGLEAPTEETTGFASCKLQETTIGCEASDTKISKEVTDFDMDGDVVTVMVKNIPCRCSKQEVLDAITSVGYGNTYSFFCLPGRGRHAANFGYAFVGFDSGELAVGFTEAMTGYRFSGRSSLKACEIAPARIQDFRRYVGSCKKRVMLASRLHLSI